MIDWLSRIPLFGPMFACSARDHFSAIADFSITVAFSSITFWLSAIILSILDINRGISYVDVLSSTVQGGELFIFSLGILGPILIIIMDDARRAKNFPSGKWLIFVLVVSALVCGSLFAILKASATPGVSGLIADKDQAISISFWMAGVACALRYLTIAYNKSLSRFSAEDLQAGEQQFKNAFATRHGKGN